ncbi:MAG: glutathione S-transferase family protein [Nannocystaceae bacterium]|nr:glutathione S-transferase family protein [Nannocystaceae bacterium]
MSIHTTPPPNLRFYTYPLGPFVQPVLITLLETGLPFETQEVDVHAKPQWLEELSPTGKVPLLKTDGVVLFESLVIVEYLDEITGGALSPSDPRRRARNRSWRTYAMALLDAMFGVMIAKDESGFAAASADVEQRYARLESELGEGPYFEGADLSLADLCFAPAFVRQRLVDSTWGFDVLQKFPRVDAWAWAVLERPSVRDSLPGSFEAAVVGWLRSLETHLARLPLR